MSDGKVLRVYLRGPAGPFRDYEASKVDIAPDGSMTLTLLEDLGEKTDLKTGRPMQGFKHTLLAVIGPDGGLRAETVDAVPQEADPRVN